LARLASGFPQRWSGAWESEGDPPAAKRAFVTTRWRKDRALRSRVLIRMAERFEARAGELVDMLALQNGKTKPQGRREVAFAPETLRFNAALVRLAADALWAAGKGVT
jgi:betaine-aldehyde dehydrogenase